MSLKHPKIDLKDRKILFELDHNSRQSNAEIAKKVGLSKDVVNYRINKLEKNGIIKKYYTLIDFDKLGFLSVRIYLKLLDTGIEKEKEIITFLTEHKNVFALSEIDGPFDIFFSVFIKNIHDFERFYTDEFKRKFKEYIGIDNISIFTKVYHFPREYILDKKTNESATKFVGETIETKTCDELDINILSLLAQNSRIPTIEIAQQLNTPSRTIAYRIKQLEKNKVIQGYRFVFDFYLFGYDYFKVDLILKDISRINLLKSYAKTHPNIIYLNETIGGSDFQFDLEIETKEKFLELIDELRMKFPEIRSWSYYTMKKFIKLSYFPEI